MQQALWDEKEIPRSLVPISWGYKRPVAVGLLERLAEERLAKHFSWNLAVVRGAGAATDNGGSGAFRLIGASAALDPGAASFETLRVSKWKRFGNAVRQLRNVFFVAEAYNVKRIDFPSPHDFFSGAEIGPFRLSWSGAPPPTGGTAYRFLEPLGLEGDFFSIAGLGLRPSAADQARLIARYVRPLVAPPLSEPDPGMRDDDLVMHFRAGDVFRSGTEAPVHPGYGQPPLSYYLGAAAREKASRVWIVFEDTGNPAVKAAEAALKAQGIEVRMQSGALGADLSIVMSARCLVGSFGSFCLAAAALSRRTRKLYQFGPPIPALQHLGIAICEGVDIPGDYRRAVTSNNWTASPAQLELMLSYPRKAIGFVDHSAVARDR
jgi:hypothetical protein